jgi:phosphate-selective porin OprO/OprP
MRTHLIVTSMAIAALSAGTASAQNSGWKPLERYSLPGWESADGENSFAFRGRVYYDMADIGWSSPYGGQPERSEFRTARFGMQAEYGDFKFVVEYDFSGADASPKDVYMNYRSPVGDFRFGHFKTMNSLDEMTSSRHTTFMERGLATDLFHLDRRIGLSYSWSGHGFLASAGVFGAPMDNNFAFRESGSSSAVAARLVWTGEIDGTRIHLGGSWRGLDYDMGTRVRAYPQMHLSNRFRAADYRPGAAAGEADRSDFYGLEAAAVRGPFHIHGEFARLDIDGPAGSPGFDSGFVQAGWILTGETRPYKASSGAFDRIVADRPLSAGGPGAWEVAARYDVTDMGAAGLGDIRSATIGLNWYPLKKVRVGINYVDAELDAPVFTETSDGWQMRVQFDW